MLSPGTVTHVQPTAPNATVMDAQSVRMVTCLMIDHATSHARLLDMSPITKYVQYVIVLV